MAAFGFLVDENVAQSVPPGSTFQAGITDVDPGTVSEQGIYEPWMSNPEYSWDWFDCSINAFLDSGMVLHMPLPQSNPAPDDLGVTAMDTSQTWQAWANNTQRGVGTISTGTWAAVAQRMSNSIYTFCLRGYATRWGYQIPLPSLKTVCGVPAIPDRRQFGYNKIIANYGGVPYWLAEWDKWYFVAAPPKADQLAPPNLAQHIRPDVVLPTGIQVPYSPVDDSSVAQGPTGVPFQ